MNRTYYSSTKSLLCLLLLVALPLGLQQCKPKDATNPDVPPENQKISQFDRAGMCDFLIDKSGIYHAVFQESPDNGKPVFIYYSTSTNRGASWSKPVNLSNDNTGNGAGYARILQDGSGTIYAIWKRYGNTATQYPIGDVILDGPGGYTLGTLFYSVRNGDTWSRPVQISETQQTQDSWFATVDPDGDLDVFWTQLGPAAVKNNNNFWYYCDYMRVATLKGASAISDLTRPWAPAKQYDQMPQQGYINLNGYVDRSGVPHLTYETLTSDGLQVIAYYNGQATRIVYTYPRYSTNNTFNSPAKLVVDERGSDHLLLRPVASTLESEQLWDMNLSTNRTVVIANIKTQGTGIYSFQATQGPNGTMGVVMEAGPKAGGNTEAYGCFYSNGTWQTAGLTNNAAKESFTRTDIGTTSTNSTVYIASLTRYNSTFGSIAWDPAGKKSMAMNLSAYWSSGSYSTSSPAIVFVPID